MKWSSKNKIYVVVALILVFLCCIILAILLAFFISSPTRSTNSSNIIPTTVDPTAKPTLDVDVQIINCTDQAYKDYRAQWLSACEVNHITTRVDEWGYVTCILPTELSDPINESYQVARSICFSVYK